MVKGLPPSRSNFLQRLCFNDPAGQAARQAVGFSWQAFRQRLKREAQEAI
jgi:hypothetical protein